MPARRFGKRRWRRPERMTLEHPPVVRRKDLGVSEPVAVEPELARRASRRQIEILLASFFAACGAQGLVVGLAIGHPWLSTLAALSAGAVYFLAAREFGDAWIARALRARPSEGLRVQRLAAAEARTARIPVPRVLVVDGEEPNAASFALRRRWLVTTRACEDMDELALEGLVAHEIVHLRDGDAAVAALYTVLAGGPELLLRGAGVLTLLSLPILPATLALRPARRVAMAPGREHRADIASAMLTRYPPGMATALRAARGGSAGLRVLDPFWFVGRDSPGAVEEAERRAGLVGEM